MCPWDVQADGDKKRSLPASIAEERERRLSSTSSSRKNSGGNATPYDSASADESQSDSVANRLRRSCGLGAGGSAADRRRGSSAACTPQQTVDRPSVSSAEDIDAGPSPESRSPEKQPPPTSPAAAAAQRREQPPSPPLDAKCNRKKLLKTLSLARKQSVTPVINVSSVDRDGAAGGCCSRSASQTESVEETATATAGEGDHHPPKTAASATAEGVAAAATTTKVANSTDGNDVCPWEDE